VRKELSRCLAVCARRGCPIEFILKDVSTVGSHPERLWEWARIAAELIGKRGPGRV
jgi:hypothetical protein